FAFTHFVVGNNCARRRKDIFCRTIILLELDRTDPWKILFERQNVLDVGTAPAVDRLILVADDAHIVMYAREMPYKPVLLAVGVLVLIDHDIWETFAVLLADCRKLIEQINGLDQQIVEVESIRFL